MNERSHFGILIFTAIFAAVVGYRLPETIIPEHYDLTILTHLDEKENFTFSGTVLIQVRALEEINSIVLHSKELEIIENEIVVKAIDHNDVIPVSNVTYNKDVDFLIIDLDKALNKDSQYEVKIPFKGIISNALVGYYRSSFKNGVTGEKEWLAVTQFEANYARNAFPCFDEPILKATFSISLGRKEGLTSLSNMPLLETQPIEGMNGWYCDKYEKSVPMSTYLVAYMVSPFEYVQSPNTDSDILFRIWARKDAINQTRYASEIGPKVLSYYEKYFDVPYPLPKQDMVAVPDFYAGAMENWGIITYRENALLYLPNVSSTSSKFRVASVVAHELAHQWFGNLVTMKWWTDLWLNEGFATYVSILGVHHVHPEWNVLNEEAVDNLVDVFRLDSLNTSHPVSVPIGHPSEIDQIFDVISYKKGSAIIRMMNLFLGEEVFRDGVSSYLKKYKYKNAEQDDLWQSLTEAAHAAKSLAKDITVKEIMDSWTKQTGYPIINIERNYADNTANVSQKVYQSISEIKNKPNTETWWVPLSFTSSDQIDNRTSRPSEWLRKTSHMEVKNMPNPDSWVLFNVDMAGLYRVKYDDKNWELLTNELKKPSHGGIPTLNRMQLVLDSMDLAWTRQLDYNMSLRLLEYINNEEEYIPWRGAMIGLGRIHSILKRTPDYGIFKKYMRKLIAPAFKKTGGLFSKIVATPDKLDSVKHQILISSWACRVDVPSCKEHALELFDMWMKEPNPDEKNDIPSDLRSEVYCIGINRGGEAEWDFLWKRYLNTNIASEREILLRSLGCTSEVWMMKRILEWSITEKSGIRQQDAYTVFDKIGSSDIGYYVAKHFLYEKANDIRKYHKATPSVMGRYIRTIAGQISSRNELKEFSKWIEDNRSLFKESSLAIGQSLESGIVRLEWKDVHQKTVIDVLKGLI